MFTPARKMMVFLYSLVIGIQVSISLSWIVNKFPWIYSQPLFRDWCDFVKPITDLLSI